jgi:hypothetical protein
VKKAKPKEPELWSVRQVLIHAGLNPCMSQVRKMQIIKELGVTPKVTTGVQRTWMRFEPNHVIPKIKLWQASQKEKAAKALRRA